VCCLGPQVDHEVPLAKVLKLLGVGEGSAYISSSPLLCNELNCLFDSIKRPFGQANLRAFHQKIHVWANNNIFF